MYLFVNQYETLFMSEVNTNWLPLPNLLFKLILSA